MFATLQRSLLHNVSDTVSAGCESGSELTFHRQLFHAVLV